MADASRKRGTTKRDAAMSELTFDVEKENFETAVIQGSHERVVMVDLWAPWCGPCRTLSPILEEVVEEMAGGVAVAKVNVDENPELAAAFKVQGIPAVKIFVDGQVVQEFSGALPKEQILEILSPFVTTAADDLMERADAVAAAGDLEGADRLYQQILADKPADQEATLALALVRLRLGGLDAAAELAATIEQGNPGYEKAQAVHKQIELGEICAQAGGAEASSPPRPTPTKTCTKGHAHWREVNASPPAATDRTACRVPSTPATAAPSALCARVASP